MTINQMISRIAWIELDRKYDADCRRVMQQERFALTAAARSGDPSRIKAAMDEARRVAAMWQVPIEQGETR